MLDENYENAEYIFFSLSRRKKALFSSLTAPNCSNRKYCWRKRQFYKLLKTMVNQPHLPHSGPTIERIKYTRTQKKNPAKISAFLHFISSPNPLRFVKHLYTFSPLLCMSPCTRTIPRATKPIFSHSPNETNSIKIICVSEYVRFSVVHSPYSSGFGMPFHLVSL